MKFSSMIAFTFLFIFLVSTVSAYDKSGHIGLLTVSEGTSNVSEDLGGVADLELTIKDGSGKIYIESFPLSKIDTQVTMRFANELACDYLDMDCSKYDFFYTIRANTALVGGPSAGAASTVLTAALLDDVELDPKTVMTGTINSGYLVGPVAGISAKSYAAQQHGYAKVLVPRWDFENVSLNPLLTLKVVPVSTLDSAMYEFTGKNYSKSYPAQSHEGYYSIMSQITTELCSKYGYVKDGIIMMPDLSFLNTSTNVSLDYVEVNETSISGNISANENTSNTNSTRIRNSRNDYYILAQKALANKEYYSAASFCFGGNVVVKTEKLTNISKNDFKKEFDSLEADLLKFRKDLDNRDLKSISELETYMIVRERVSETEDILSIYDSSNISTRELAYALERFDTAKVWSRFFEMSSREYTFESSTLKIACEKKLQEAEERISYLQSYLSENIDRKDLNDAYVHRSKGEYPLCIFTAAKTKADIDVVLGALFVNDKSIPGLLADKLEAAKIVVARQEAKGVFPILGFSYYEYSNTLKSTDKYSALIYSEYALELGNLDMYFPKKSLAQSTIRLTQRDYIAAIGGFIVGILLVLTVVILMKKPSKIQRKK